MSRMDVLGSLPLLARSQFRDGNKGSCVHCGSKQITFSYIRDICTFTCLTCKAKETISGEELRKSAQKVLPTALIRVGD